jgi:short-subunit dehydrogenase
VKTILITGASSGIGRALAVRAARAGYGVYAVGRNMKALAALGAQVSEEGGVIKTDITDVSEPANAPGLIGRMLGAFGQIDIVVNNAGAVAVGPIATQSDDDLRAQFGTHVIGPLAIVREALPSLRATRGQVFMVGSGVARVPVGGLGAYPSSKAALRSATTILRREVTPLDIAVTYVDPGAVDTAFMSRAGLPGAPPSMLVSPELVARKILFAIGTRPRVLNVAPLQTAAVAIAELLPAVTEAILERNPQLIGSGPQLALTLNGNGRTEKIALPASTPLQGTSADEQPLADTDADDDAELDDETLAEAEIAVATIAEPIAEPAPEPERDAFAEARGVEDVIAAEPATELAAAPPAEPESIPTATVVAATSEAPRAARWTYEPPEADDAVLVEPPATPSEAVAPAAAASDAIAPAAATGEPTERAPFTVVPRVSEEELFAEPDEAPAPVADDEPAHATSSFDAALEPLRNRMVRAKLDAAFVRELLVPDAVLDVGETAMRWAGMPNKHERALTSEVFFALAEWGFLAPRADGRYRVITSPNSANV